MEYILDKKQIIQSLKNTMVIVAKKSINDQYSCVSIELSNKTTRITGTNGYFHIISNPEEQNYNHKFMVNCNKLYSLLNKISSNQIIVNFHNNYVQIYDEQKKDQFELTHININHNINLDQGVKLFQLSKEKILSLINYIDIDTDGKNFGKLYFNISNQNLSIVNYDRVRLSFVSESIDYNDSLYFSIDSRLINILKKIVKGPVDFYLSKDYLIIQMYDIHIYAKKIEGSQINYNRFIRKIDKPIIIKTKDLSDGLSKVNITASEINNSVFLKISDQITLQGFNPIMGTKGTTVVPHDNPDNIVGQCRLSIKYILKAIKHISSEYINLYFEHPNKPVVIKPNNDIENYHILMPILIK